MKRLIAVRAPTKTGTTPGSAEEERMALVVKKLEDETWRQAALRYAARHGLEDEVEGTFNQLIDLGLSDREAALGACAEWDVADFEDRP